MYYTYIIESITKPGIYYRGHTGNLKQRLEEHNSGKCKSTEKKRPWRIKTYVAFDTIDKAQQFEKYLKSGSGHAFAKRHFGI